MTHPITTTQLAEQSDGFGCNVLHAAPIVYRDMHVQLDGPEACAVICLGEPIWAPTWAGLRSEIEARLDVRRRAA